MTKIDWNALTSGVEAYDRGSRSGVSAHYGGRRMRSQLEIRWARWFDAIALPWIYEPESLRSPTGWLPDFALHHPADEGTLLIEVKPTAEHFIAEGGWSFYDHPDHATIVLLSAGQRWRDELPYPFMLPPLPTGEFDAWLATHHCLLAAQEVLVRVVNDDKPGLTKDEESALFLEWLALKGR